ncbi:DsbA family oxidoreductase [Marinobacter salinisoli]|uniref:DsbA family oxidoreductase n=1 Tax=Marinobacter salinisoli TaxID=2769486 RepID=A0ABX7MQW5_9GAMM|nr:DsbA family oxidoreductase [Marinobacter salinisoli]QSP94732.1 DsbA family oxidoreductase [Marinobacter salinisoli]
MTQVHIDIVSDIACPWCAIGYKRLEKAMQELGDELEFDIQWRAFELNPDSTNDGEAILPALARKYGRSEDEMRANQAQMMDIASGLGLNFEKLQQRHTRNTFDAHRLLKWAAEQGKQTELKLAFFEAYFGRAENISNTEVLLAAVEQVGLDTDAAKAVLASNRYADDVRGEELRYQQAGVSSVPAYIINEKYLISGAQEPETLVEALREIAAEN